MKRTTKTLLLIATHAGAVGAGVALGIYLLPILIAPASPSSESVRSAMAAAAFTGEFRRNLADSDALHWGEGTLTISNDSIGFVGELAPGPDYRLYLSPVFVETEAAFAANKAQMVQIAPIRTFENFLVALPESVDPAAYSTAIVWCESFGQFISAAAYQPVEQN